MSAALRCAAALTTLLALPSCTTPARLADLPHYGKALAPIHLAQLDDHQFGACAAATCAQPTPKQRAAARPPVTAPAQTAGAASEPIASVASSLSPPPLRDADKLTISFALGSARLTPAAGAAIDTALDRAPAPILRLVVRGRTDASGTAASNARLAQARALAVRDRITRRRPDLVAVVALESRGSCCYAAPNDHAAGRQRNRRVEIEIERAHEPVTDDL